MRLLSTLNPSAPLRGLWPHCFFFSVYCRRKSLRALADEYVGKLDRSSSPMTTDLEQVICNRFVICQNQIAESDREYATVSAAAFSRAQRQVGHLILCSWNRR